MSYEGDIRLEDTIDIKFCTVTTTGAPTVLAGSPAVSAYVGNGLTQLTAGITLSVDFDGVVGLNNVRVVATAANGYTAPTDVTLVLTAGTVGGTSVVGYCVGSFSIEHRSAIMPTVVARKLDVSAGGEAGVDWANVGTPGSTVGLSATTVATVTTTTTATNVTTVNGLAAGVITAAAVATNAIDADALATDAVTEIQSGLATSAALATVQADTDNIQTRLPAALVGGRMDSDVGGWAGTAVATPAIAGVPKVNVEKTGYDGGMVWFDTGGAAGTTSYVHGTTLNPNSSIANCRTIADALGMKQFQVNGGSTVTLDQGYTAYSFRGSRWTLALASRAITNSHFTGAAVTGLSTGTGTEWDDCDIGTVTIANGSTFHACGMSGTFTIQAAGTLVFENCYSNTVAGVDWILDFGALGATTVGLRNFAGGVELRNMAAGDVFAFTGDGRVTIASSCTAGTVLIAGNVTLVNSGSGQTITDSSRFNEDQTIANVTTVNGLAAGVITAASIATNAIDADALAADAVTEIQSGLATSSALATVQADTDDIQTRLPAALVSGRMDSSVGAVAANAITAASIATDAIDADAIAANAVTEIQAGLATAAALDAVDNFLDTEIADIKAKTDLLNFSGTNVLAEAAVVADKTGYSIGTGGIVAASFGAAAIDASAIAANAIGASEIATDAVTEIADGILNRDMSVGTDSGSPTVRTPRQALRAIRNKVGIVAGTLTVTKEDDTTASWTAEVTTSAGDPISEVDPA